MEIDSSKIIIFDLDGTLVDLNSDWNEINALRADGREEKARNMELDSVENSRLILRTVNFLKKLKSNRKAIFSMNTREVIVSALKKFNLMSEFSYIVSRDDVKMWKPDPEGLQMILNHFNLGSGNFVYVGDRDIDAYAAYRAGIEFINAKDIKC